MVRRELAAGKAGVNPEGNEVGRFGLTGHSRDLSWKVLESTEDSLAHLLGVKWTEAR